MRGSNESILKGNGKWEAKVSGHKGGNRRKEGDQ